MSATDTATINYAALRHAIEHPPATAWTGEREWPAAERCPCDEGWRALSDNCRVLEDGRNLHGALLEQAQRCDVCHGTGYLPAVDPDDLLGWCPPGAHEFAAWVACVAGLPVWEAWAKPENNRDWCRQALLGTASSNPDDMPTWTGTLPLPMAMDLVSSVAGIPVEVAFVCHAIGAWWRGDSGKFSLALMECAGLDLARWRAEVTRRLAVLHVGEGIEDWDRSEVAG